MLVSGSVRRGELPSFRSRDVGTGPEAIHLFRLVAPAAQAVDGISGWQMPQLPNATNSLIFLPLSGVSL